MTAPLLPAETDPAAATGEHPPPQRTPLEVAALAALAAYVAGSALAGGAVTAAALVALLARLGIRRRATRAVLALNLAVGVTINVSGGYGPAGRRTAADSPMWRAAYLLEAGKRLDRALTRPATERDRNGLTSWERALADERRYLDQHLQAAAARAAAAARVDQAAAEHGPLLGWYTDPTSKVTPACAAMHGSNFYAQYPPPIGYPGSVHRECHCSAGAPHRNGRVVATPGMAPPQLVALAAERNRAIELARYVRTPAGVARYKRPIGALITEKGGRHTTPGETTAKGRRSRAMPTAERVTRAVERRNRLDTTYRMAAAKLDRLDRKHAAQALGRLTQPQLYGIRNAARTQGRGVNPDTPMGRSSAKAVDAIDRELARRVDARVRSWDDATLDRATQRALQRNRLAEFERYAAELDRRDAEARKADDRRAKAREARQRRADEREREQAELYERLLSDGVDELEAVERSYGVSVKRQKEMRAANALDAAGFHGPLRTAARAAFDADAQSRYLAAEDATNGHMLTREGENRGIDPGSLFKGNDARARRYASPELLEWWDQHGRPTFAEFLAELLDDQQAAARLRSARGDYYT